MGWAGSRDTAWPGGIGGNAGSRVGVRGAGQVTTANCVLLPKAGPRGRFERKGTRSGQILPGICRPGELPPHSDFPAGGGTFSSSRHAQPKLAAEPSLCPACPAATWSSPHPRCADWVLLGWRPEAILEGKEPQTGRCVSLGGWWAAPAQVPFCRELPARVAPQHMLENLRT